MRGQSNILQLMESRAQLYRFFARLFEKEIDESFFLQLKNMHFPEEMGGVNQPDFQEAAKGFNEYFQYNTEETLDDLAADYASTFLSAGKAVAQAAFPYESVYTSPKRIMMQDDLWNPRTGNFWRKGRAVRVRAGHGAF